MTENDGYDDGQNVATSQRKNLLADGERNDGENDKARGERNGELGEDREKNRVDVEMEEEERKMGMDEGYAWLIVFGAFLCWVLVAGFLKSGGIFFLQFQSQFQLSALQAAWPGAVNSLIQNLSGPLVSTVCNRFSVRASVMIGSVLTFVGLVLNAFAYNYYFLFFCHSLLQGMGLGFVLTPGLFIVSAYFDKRRGFAVSLASAGGGAGAFVVVPLITFLFDIYGFHGCFLVLAGVLSNTFVVAMLYRPFTAHQKYLLALERNKKQDRYSNLDMTENGECALLHLKETKTTVTLPPPTAATKMSTHTSSPSSSQQDHQPTRNQLKRKSSALRLKSSFKIIFPTEHKKSSSRKLFHWALLKDASFVLYLINTFLFTMALKATFTFIPAACVDKGLSDTDAALVLSIAGAVDTIGRIGMGFLFDTARLKPYRLGFFTGSLFGIAFCTVFFPLLQNFTEFLLLCSILGTFFGAHISQRAVVLVDLMGKELLPSCMGLIRVVQAFAMMAGPLLFGALRDSTGSYEIPFFVGSGLSLLAGICLLVSNVVFRIEQRRKLQKQEPEFQQQ